MSEPFSQPACRTLVVILSMHRSGSSLTTEVLGRLGMSLGPFELVGPLESNRRGHFEPVPVNHFDMDLQRRVLGFEGDMPPTEKSLARFLECDGRWDPAVVSSAEWEFGRGVIRQLTDSSKVAGFKDPRVLLLWPYWREVFAGFDGLRVVPLILVRWPHEVAMSIFLRGRGKYSYHDALDVTAVNLRRLEEIRRTWEGPQALVRFDPRVYADDLRSAAAVCNLPWREECLAECYDPRDRHHDPTRVDHEAQCLFDALAGAPEPPQREGLLRLARDGALREKTIQSEIHELRAEILALRGEDQALHTTCRDLLAATEFARQQGDVLARQCEGFAEGMRQIHGELPKLGAAVTHLADARRSDSAQLNALEAAFRTWVQGSVERSSELAGRMERVAGEVVQLRTENEDLREALRRLGQRVEALENDLLRRTVARLRGVCDRFRRPPRAA